MRNYRFATYPRHNSLVVYAMVQIDLRSRFTSCRPKLLKKLLTGFWACRTYHPELAEGVILSLSKEKKFGCNPSSPYFCHPLENERWPVRLSARTSPFHGGKTGSIPVRAT
jgi:hypothetical protein